MENYSQDGVRKFLPEPLRASYRAARNWLLSLGVRGHDPSPQTDAEKAATTKLSVVVAVHDAPEVTSRCLASLEMFCAQTEIILVDDASQLDVTRQLLNEACARNGWRLIRHPTAMGHSRASAAGIEASTRRYICLLNSDTVVTQHSWAGIVGAFESDPRIAVGGPSTSCTTGPQTVRRALHCRHEWSNEQIWNFAGKYAGRHKNDALIDLPMVGGFAFFVRRSIWDQLGGFDKNLPDYGNETEFCRRVIEAGLRIVWARNAYIHHFGSESYGRKLGLGEIQKRCVESQAYISKTR